MINWAAFKRARAYLSGQRWQIVAAEVCAVLNGICVVALVLLLGLLGELLFTSKHSLGDLIFDTRWRRWYGPALGTIYDRIPALRDPGWCLALLLAAGVVLAALRALCEYLQARTVNSAVVDAARRLRRAIFHQAYRLGTTEVSGIGAEPAINVFTRETNAVRDGLHAWLDARVREPLTLMLLFVVALMVHWALALLFLVSAALVWFLSRPLKDRARAREATATRSAAERLALIQESLFMIRLTRGYLMESQENERFERNLGQFALSEARRLRSAAGVAPLLEFLAVLCITLVAGLAGYNLVHLNALSAASTVILYASLVSLYWPARTLLDRYRIVRQGADSAAAVFVFLDQHSKFGQVADARFLPPMSKTLEFVRINVEEPREPPVLHGINLTIRAGTRTAIMGLDERAKRALVYLIPRFLDPTEGAVRIDGHDVRLATLESLRAQVALVLQGELTFHDTVAGNIGCGDLSFGLPHIVDAAKIAHAHSFVQRLPRGYDTVIGGPGEALSVSQQFRIALARAILRDPTIVVIEEPRVHLDDDTKDLLDDTMSRFCPGRTVLFLPHRLTTIRSCDDLVILHEGKIQAVGNHRDLTLTSELYRHLQYTEFNVFAAV